MKTTASRYVALAFLVSTLAFAGRADTLVNDFSTPFDYAANGIIGDTNWDGVYLRFGDVPGGNVGTAGAGNTPIAGTAVGPFSGFLSLQNVGGNWTAAEDDGFFIYKLVQGDFDVSVESVPGSLSGGTGFDNRANNLAGLMIRSYHTNNSGAPYSTTLTNNSENNVRLWRFNEFNIDGQVRYASNASNVELNFDVAPGNNIATNDSRFFRIVRMFGTNFTFYRKTNSFDAWIQITNGLPTNAILSRADWAGQPLQVGICQAAFSTFTRDALFDNFQLSGSGVTFPAMPPAPTGLVTMATNTGGSLTFSWTTNGGDGSLVVMSTRPIQHNPVQGITYNASSAFGDSTALIGGGGNYVVYNGPATSVTVTNLGGNSTVYRVAVFSYSTNSAPVYNTASPATGNFNGPGLINSAALSVIDNNIPTNGAVTLRLTASFSTGETSDQTANTTWLSSAPTIASVDAFGVVSGMSSGVATINATFGPFNLSTNITVHAPVGFVDNFATPFNYLTNALVGSPWDGLFMNFGDITGGVAGGDGPGATTVLNAQLSNTNGLSMTSLQSDWQGTANDGPFLYKIVPGANNSVSGDFSVVTHVNSMNTLNAHAVGLMARLYNPANHGAGPSGTENHVNYWKVQNGSTSVRRTLGGVNATLVPAGPLAANGWLLLTRVDSTNFYFFEKTVATDPWTFVTNTVLAAASNNAPMEVGIAQQTQSGVNGIAVLDNGFFLDAAGIDPGMTPPPPANGLSITLNPNLSMTLTWIAANGGVPIQSIAVMRSNAPVSAQPIYGASVSGNSVFGQGTDLGGRNYVVYVSPTSPPSTTNSVTVTGLTPGQTYYAAIYTFTGSGSTKVFNNVVPADAAVGQADGFLQGIVASLEGGIPNGGIGQLQVLADYSGIFVDVSSLPAVGVSSGDANVIKVFGGVLTGVTNGTAPITATFGGFTNTAPVTVRDPKFRDEFDVSHDYLANGVAGTGWEGWYNPAAGTNPIPGSPYVPLAGSGTTVADANVSSNSHLTITAAGDGWENANAGGFFLFKYVAGDFQISVQINTNDFPTLIGGAPQYNQPGLLARAYGVDTNGLIGAPFGTVVSTNLGEYWVSLCRFDEFTIGTYARRNLNGVVSQNGQPDQNDLNYWLLIKRTGGTRFDFFKRLNPTDPWRRVPNNTSYLIPEFAGRPMQVGIMGGPWSNPPGTQRTVHFDRFMLDTTSGSLLQISVAGSNATLSWPPIPNATLQSTDSLNPVNWQNVPGTATLGPNGYSLAVPLGAGTKFFRLAQ